MLDHGVEVSIVLKQVGSSAAGLHKDHYGEWLILRILNRYFLFNSWLVTGLPEADRTNVGTITNVEVDLIVELEASCPEVVLCPKAAWATRIIVARDTAFLTICS